MKKEIEKVRKEAERFFEGASGCHDWTHVERVRNLALHIAKKEKADLAVVELAAFLHDIGRKKEMKTKGVFCHAKEGAKLASAILSKCKIDEARKMNVIHCIEAHRSKNDLVPETIEAKCLFDADKLDSLGMIGVARIFLFAGHSASNRLYTGNEKKIARTGQDFAYTKEDTAVLEWEIKLKHIKNKMLTKTGRKMSAIRHDKMKYFFKEFWLEVKGEK